MSRRKQARPRLIKREEDDSEANTSFLASDEPEIKKIKLDAIANGHSNKVSNGNGKADMTSEPVSSPSKTEVTEIFRCETCGATFGNLLNFMDHKNTLCNTTVEVKIERDGSCTPRSVDSQDSASGLSVTSQAESAGKQANVKGPPFKCGKCPRVFKARHTRDRHLKLHEEEKCTRCDAVFARDDDLLNHMKTEHDSPEVFSCQICDLEFPSMAALMSHQNAHKPKTARSKHDANDGGTCLESGAVFLCATDRESHASGNKAFQCKHCAAICVGPIALALHIEHAHSTFGSDHNRCPLCFKYFLSLDELVAHMKSHDSNANGIDTKDSNIECIEIKGVEYGASILSSVNGMCVSDILICPYCFRDDFDSLEGLELHMQSVHTVKPTEVYTCNYCNAPYKNLYSLHEHMRAIHQNKPSMGIKYPCSLCGKEFSSIESLQDHKKRNHHNKQRQADNVYTCSFCALLFLSPSALNEHITNTHADLVRRFEERNHGKSPEILTNSSRLSVPVARSKDTLSSYPENNTIINVPEPSQILRHLRSPAQKLASPTSTIHHRATMPSNKSKSSPSRPHSAGSRKVENTPRTEGMKCEQCNAQFTDLDIFETHMKLHSGSMIGQLTCRQCSKLFLTEEQLEAHLSLHFLSPVSEYGCKSCNKTYDKPDELQKHLIDIHAINLYQCSLCKDVYDSKVNIQVHFAIKHSNECKLYRCSTCDVVYRRESEWLLHLRVKHLQLSKPYRCLFCKESFSVEMDLQCHLATHNKLFKCSMCEESFLVEYLLDKHLQLVHSEAGSSSETGNIHYDVTSSNGTHAKTDKSDVVIKQESGTSSMLFNKNVTTKAWSQPSGTLVAGSATLLGDNHQLFQKLTSSANGGGILLSDGSGPLFPSGLPNVISSGSLVWKSQEDLYRCNICDVKFGKLSALQSHKMQDHGLKLVIGNKYSPESSPKHVTSTSGCFESNPVIYIDTVSRNGTEPEISSVSDKPASLLHTALTSSLTSSMSLTGVNLPESPTSEATYSEKLISTYGDKVCLACPFCSQTFKSKSELEKHSKIHVNTGSQKCNICDEVFESSGILAEHKLTHCKIQQGNVCVACKMPLNVEEQFYLHSQEHGFQGAVMQCIVCRQTLSSLLELQMHGKHHFQSRSFCSYTCCVCLKSFDSDENLVSKINGSGRTYYICKPCYLGKAEFPCPQCGARYTTSSGLEEHVHSHKKSYQCIKCQESFSSEQEIQLHVATHMMTEGNIHECCICFTILDSPAKLQCHLIEHTFANSEFKCHACGRKFKSAAEIQTHALDHGVLARKYNCSLCSQRFFFSAELENHNYVHQKSRETSLSDSDKGFLSQHLTIYPLAHPVFEEKPVSSLRGHSPVKGQSTVKFQSPAQNVKKHVEESDLSCTKCDKSFRSVILLSEHYKMCNVASLASAVGSWTHGCPCCSENFQTLSELQNHMYKEHSKAESMDPMKLRHACSECGKECSSEHNLLTHMSTHRKGEKHVCSKCTRVFSTAVGLSVHMAAKCHGYQYECPVCQVRFAKKTQKMDHMKSHSGDKVYPCLQCGLLFTCKDKLKVHSDQHSLETDSSQVPDEANVMDEIIVSSKDVAATGNVTSVEQNDARDKSDSEKDGMKPEVTSTCSLSDEGSMD